MSPDAQLRCLLTGIDFALLLRLSLATGLVTAVGRGPPHRILSGAAAIYGHADAGRHMFRMGT